MNLRRFLPTTTFLMTTQYSVEEVRDILKKNTSEKRKFALTYPLFEAHPFEGEVNDNYFNFRSIENRKSSTVPNIEGWFATTERGTKLQITIKLRDSVTAFMLFWFGALAIMWLLFTVIALTNIAAFFHGRYYIGIILPPAMFLFVYKLATGSYKRECKKAEMIIINILNAHIVDSL